MFEENWHIDKIILYKLPLSFTKRKKRKKSTHLYSSKNNREAELKL